MQLCNDPSTLDFESSWTYSHPSSGKRQLDYILTSRDFIISSSHATPDIDLGSDHRAVVATLQVHQSKKRRWTKPRIKRGWLPSDSYQREVADAMQKHVISSLDDLRDVLSVCAQTCTRDVSPDEWAKPWKSEAVKALVAQRKACSNREERARLSKAISTTVRQLSRQGATARTCRVLNEINDLN